MANTTRTAATMASGKKALKRGLQYLVSTLGRPLWAFPDRSLVILMYHRVLPEDHHDWNRMQPGMVVSTSSLDLHLSVLKEHFTVIHLSEWIRRSQSGKEVPPLACAITFDDGWADNYEFAYPILRRHQVPATIFLVSDYVGTSHRFWPERLGELLHAASAIQDAWVKPEFKWLRRLDLGPDRSVDEAISAVKALPDREITARVQEMEKRLEIQPALRSPCLMTWEQARALAQGGIVEYGSHTRTHHRLGKTASAGPLFKEEIVGSKDAIEQQIGKPVELFCYPNGEISPEAETLVRRHYLAACSTIRGWNRAGYDPHRLRRIGIHNDVSSEFHAFMSRLSGWL